MIPRHVRVTTGSRLHFGLLSWNPRCDRRFGSVGLMIEAPGLELEAVPAKEWSADGPLASRVLVIARTVAADLADSRNCPPLHLRTVRAAPEHHGLGTGTQLSLAVASCIAALGGRPVPDVIELARLTGRGRRSGIGVHGFGRGGVLVDGGRRASQPGTGPPLLFHSDFPSGWAVLLIIPPTRAGLSGSDELQAFDSLPGFPDALVDRLCRLVLLDLLPAVLESDLSGFGTALEAIQRGVGKAFAPAQGGTFADAFSEKLGQWLQTEHVVGVGQSSWGPALYGFMAADPERQAAIRTRLIERFQLEPDSVIWTRARNRPADVSNTDD